MQRLTSEIQYYIFRKVQEKSIKDLSNCALVNKAWLSAVQNVLYSKVKLQCVEVLQKFLQTVERNPQLGMKVKSLELGDPYMDYKAECDFNSRGLIIMTNLIPFLSNLEAINDYAQISFVPVMDALLDSRLKHLKRIQSPGSSTTSYDNVFIYVSCALLLKDRLENLSITGISDKDDNVLHSFGRLSARINQFSRLKELYISKQTTDAILFLDNIIESCPPSLESIRFRITIDRESIQTNTHFSIDEISTLVPRPNIKHFQNFGGLFSEGNIFTYVEHKFPQLDFLRLELSENTTTQKISSETLEQFLHYMSRIKKPSVSVYLDYNNIIKSFGNFWKATSAPGREAIKFNYSKHYSSHGYEQCLSLNQDLRLERRFSSFKSVLPLDSGWAHVKFLEENGKFLRSVVYSCISDETKPPFDLITHTLIHCPSIQVINLEYLKLIPLDDTPSNEKYSLDELLLRNCTIQQGGLEWLSTVLAEVRNLQLIDENFRYGDCLAIMMPQTKVDEVVIGVSYEHLRYVKLLCAINGSYSYYKLDNEQVKVLPSTEEEYLDADELDCLEVCFKTKPIIKCRSMSAY